jgi:CAAX protease family protein
MPTHPTKDDDMNTNTFDLYALIILLILAIAIPLIGIWDFRRLIRWAEEGRADARVKTYQWILGMEWLLTAGLLGWWLAAGRSFATVGLIPIAERWQWLAIGVGIALTVFMIGQMLFIARKPDQLAKIREQMGDLVHLAPRTPTEDRLFVLVSITAGVCEEVLYRGLLLAALSPVVGTWTAVALSSVIFGLGHVYQGFEGIGKTTFIGLVMALLTVFSGSIFVAILLHTIIDLTSGRMMGVALRTAPEASPSEQ